MAASSATSFTMFHIARAARLAVPRVAARALMAPPTATAGLSARLSPMTATAALRYQCQCRGYASSASPAKSKGDGKGEDEADLEAVAAGVEELAAKPGKYGADSGGRWTLVGRNVALERSFRFKNFTKTWDFMTAVSLQCKLNFHHPEWSNMYDVVFVRWTTHSKSEPGLTAKDIQMARLCDELGTAYGELAPRSPKTEAKVEAKTETETEAETAANGGGRTGTMQSLADTATCIAGGDCCNHKSQA